MAETRTRRVWRGGGRAGQGQTQEVASFGREVMALGAEIRELQGEDGADSVMARVEIGKRLMRARERLVHGQWEQFVRSEAGYGRMMAGKLVRLAKWAPKNRRVLQRVQHLGPTKVYFVMEAPVAAVKRLLAQKRHTVPGTGRRKVLEQLSAVELSKVLKTLDGTQPAEEMAAGVEAQEVLDELLREAKRVVRGTNKLLKLRQELADPDASAEVVAQVHKRLLRSAKKLEKAFGVGP